jgi:UDP-glucose 4-epimerase
MNILVTGAAGYIGSICAEVLLARGMRVIAMDSLVEGHRPAVPPGAIFLRWTSRIVLSLIIFSPSTKLTP